MSLPPPRAGGIPWQCAAQVARRRAHGGHSPWARPRARRRDRAQAERSPCAIIGARGRGRGGGDVGRGRGARTSRLRPRPRGGPVRRTTDRRAGRTPSRRPRPRRGSRRRPQAVGEVPGSRRLGRSPVSGPPRDAVEHGWPSARRPPPRPPPAAPGRDPRGAIGKGHLGNATCHRHQVVGAAFEAIPRWIEGAESAAGFSAFRPPRGRGR